MDEVLKVDANSKPVAGFVTDDASQLIRMGRIDDATKGLKVMIVGGAGSGTVTSVSVVSANGFAGSVATATTTPAITLSTTIGSGNLLLSNGTGVQAAPLTGTGNVVLANSPTLVTPTLGVATVTSINGNTITAGTGTLTLSTFTLTVANTASISGTNTGDQTSVSGNAGTATALQNARTIGGTSFNGTANIAIGALNITNVGATTSSELAGVISDETGSGSLVFGTNPTIAKPVVNARNQTAQTYTPAGAATATLDLSLADQHYITMPAGNITIALSNDTNNQVFLVSITQDGGGSRTVTWFTTILWAGGVAPTLTTTGSKRDTFGFIRTGSGTYDGFVIGQNI